MNISQNYLFKNLKKKSYVALAQFSITPLYTKVPVPYMDTQRKMYFFSPTYTRHGIPKVHDHYLWTVDHSYKKLATL